MENNFRKSLSNVMKSLGNVVGDLFRGHPIIFLAFVGILTYGIIQYVQTSSQMTFGLCVLISFVSVLIYIRNQNYAETILSFTLGILTIFTIEWKPDTSVLFIGFYVTLNVVIFFLSTIKLAMKVETQLKTAASFIDLKNHDEVYKVLNKTSKVDTKLGILGPLDKAILIKEMAFIKVPIEEMPKAIEHIELIHVAFQLDLESASDFYRNLYFIKRRSVDTFDINTMLDLIVSKRIPLTFSEVLTVLDKTKKVLIKSEMSIVSYLDSIEKSVYEGEDIDGIVDQILN